MTLPPHSLRVVLPQGTLGNAYDAVVPQISPQAQWSNEPVKPDELVMECKQVAIRAWHAQVDVIRPFDAAKPDGPRQLVSVWLSHDAIAGWYVTRVRPWKIPLEEALVQSVRQADVNVKP